MYRRFPLRKDMGDQSLVSDEMVDELKVSSEVHCAKILIDISDRRFNSCDVNRGPGKFRYHDNSTMPNDDYTMEADNNDKLGSVTKNPLTRTRPKLHNKALIKTEKIIVLFSPNSSLGWIVKAESPF